MSAVTHSAQPPRVAGEAADRLRRILGEHATITLVDGQVVIEPHHEDACARALAACSANRWDTAVAGHGGWLPTPPTATVRISTRRMRTILDVRPADLYASAQAGVLMEDLANELERHRVWLPIDAPGRERTVGSVLGSGTQGGMRTGFGGVRDQILGLTVITGNGRILRLGGRVVKNVAGFDLAKLVIGGFGAYGIVTAVNVKLRAIPSRDATVQLRGTRSHLLATASRILAAGMTPGALQLSSDGTEHTLTARVMGSNDLVNADASGLGEAGGRRFETLSQERAGVWWEGLRFAAVAHPVTVRIGTTPTGVVPALEIVDDYPGTTTVTLGFGTAMLRWNGKVDSNDLMHMRECAARAELPLTVERAPGAIISKVGHYGALPEGSARLARSLQTVFDPAGILSGAIWGA